MLELNLFKHLRITKMRINLLLIALSFLIWQSISITSTLYNRLENRANQIETLIQRLENEI